LSLLYQSQQKVICVTLQFSIISNLTKLEFVALDISSKNYLSWILDAEIHLEAINLGDNIKDGNQASPQNRAKAMIFIRHHLHEELKTKYLTVKGCKILKV
jgi:hypothetical protein